MGAERVLSFERASKKVATMIDSDCAEFVFGQSLYNDISCHDLAYLDLVCEAGREDYSSSAF